MTLARQPRLLGLTLLAALALAGLWLMRTERAPDTATTMPEGGVEAEPRDVDLTPPRASLDGARTIATAEGDSLAADASDLESAEGSIRGQIHGSAEREFVSAWTRLHDESGITRLSGAHDSYRFDELAPGRYWIEVGAAGHRNARGMVDLTAGEDEELDFALEASVRLVVRILTLEGEPHPDASDFYVPVATSDALTSKESGAPWSSTSSHGESRFVPAPKQGGMIGFLDLDGELPVYVSLTQYRWVWATQFVPAGSTEVAFRLDPKSERPGSLRVQAHLASTGERLMNGLVQVSNEAARREATLDGSGVAEFASLAPGEYTVTVAGAPFGLERRSVRVEASDVTEFDLEVGGGVKIEGRLVDGSGIPQGNQAESYVSDMNGVYLGRTDPSTGSAVIDRSFVYLVDEGGQFSFSAEPGLYVLSARLPGAASRLVTVDARQGPVAGVEVRALPQATVVLRVDGGNWQGARYRVLDENGLEAEGGLFRGPMPHRLELAPGTYRLLATDKTGATVFETTFAAAEGTVIVPVRL